MFEVSASNQAKKFLTKLSKRERKRCLDSFEHLRKNPFLKRPNCDIRKLSGHKYAYRLRVGSFRFNYAVDDRNKNVYIEDAFRRGRGYRK